MIVACFLGLTFAQVLGAPQELDPSPRPNLITPEERQWLNDHTDIRVAASSDYRPVEFHDKEGRFWGITSEYFNLMQSRLGVKFKYVKLSHEQWQKLDPVERGADIITASAETPHRLEFWSFTKPYLNFPTYLITRQNVVKDLTLDKLAGARVAVVQGWAAEEYLRAQFPNIIVDPVPDTATGLRKVSFGLVDAFVSDLPVATATIDLLGISNLKPSAEAGYTYRLGISVRKDWPMLKEIMEKALATITPVERDYIYRRWMKWKDPPRRFNEELWRKVLWGALGFVTVLAGVLAWNRSLASQVRERTARLNQELAGRIEANRALRASEEKFSKAFRASPDAILITRVRDGCVIEANDTAARVFACAKEDLVGHPTTGEIWGFLSAEDWDRALAAFRAQGGTMQDYELRLRRKNGETFTALTSFEAIDVAGEACLVSVTRDVTKQRAAEAAVTVLLERFELVARATNDAVWDWDLQSKTIWWYNGFHVLFGYRQEELEPGIESWTTRLHPDDRARTVDGIEAAINGTGRGWSDEYRFQRKDGTYAHVLDRGYVMRDAQGRALRMIGAMQDITDRVEAEQALRLSEEKFERAFRNSPDAIFITSLPAGRIAEVNAGACRLTGYTRTELIGQTTGELKIWRQPAARTEYLATVKRGDRVADFEADLQTKSGEARAVLVSGELIELRTGPHVISVLHDITERRRAEADRQRLYVQLLEAEDEERRRIGRDLHDSTAQHLAAIQMNLTRLRDAAPAGIEMQLIVDSLGLAVQSVQEIRSFTYLLHPPLLDDLGLAGALADYAAGFAKRSGIRVDLDASGYHGRLPRELELALFRVAQESLTNVRRHSGCSYALVRLERDAEQVRMEIQDSGRGLPAGAPLGVGLRGMRERLGQVGGALEIESDRQGTTVLASVPLSNPPSPAPELSPAHQSQNAS